MYSSLSLGLSYCFFTPSGNDVHYFLYMSVVFIEHALFLLMLLSYTANANELQMSDLIVILPFFSFLFFCVTFDRVSSLVS